MTVVGGRARWRLRGGRLARRRPPLLDRHTRAQPNSSPLSPPMRHSPPSQYLCRYGVAIRGRGGASGPRAMSSAAISRPRMQLLCRGLTAPAQGNCRQHRLQVGHEVKSHPLMWPLGLARARLARLRGPDATFRRGQQAARWLREQVGSNVQRNARTRAVVAAADTEAAQHAWPLRGLLTPRAVSRAAALER